MEQSSLLLEQITKAYNHLESLNEEVNKNKVSILCRLLQSLSKGVENAATITMDDLKVKGLPKWILVNEDFDKDLISKLSYFAPVSKLRALQKTAIVFSWTEDFSEEFLSARNILNGK